MWDIMDNKKLQNGITLNLEYAFGYYQTPIHQNTYFINEDTILYICGNHLILYDIIRKKQKYIMKDVVDEAVMSMAYYYDPIPNEVMVAVSLKSNTQNTLLPEVKVYSSTKLYSYHLVHNDLALTSQIIDVTFLGKNKVTTRARIPGPVLSAQLYARASVCGVARVCGCTCACVPVHMAVRVYADVRARLSACTPKGGAAPKSLLVVR